MLRTERSRVYFVYSILAVLGYSCLPTIIWFAQVVNPDTGHKPSRHSYLWFYGATTMWVVVGLFILGWLGTLFVDTCDKIGNWMHNTPKNKVEKNIQEAVNQHV